MCVSVSMCMHVSTSMRSHSMKTSDEGGNLSVSVNYVGP